MDFLTEKGLLIFKELEAHCKSKLKMMEIDHLELAMIANSFDLYAQTAKYCSEEGIKMVIQTEKGGLYEQIRPEYTVMKNEYQNILKHSAKFGLNPGDRSKVFKSLEKETKKRGFELNKPMKVA